MTAYRRTRMGIAVAHCAAGYDALTTAFGRIPLSLDDHLLPARAMSSEFFHKAQSFQITGSSFSQVQGDQFNSYTTTMVQTKEEERTELRYLLAPEYTAVVTERAELWTMGHVEGRNLG
ncbi:hypothetical protein PM082_007813 [Marasmius tenuissimus]|nr:hypothetical protein PM082_007813 [Marasmius tenuissimus]